eukprot:4162522-Prymnesium_polylepis.1
MAMLALFGGAGSNTRGRPARHRWATSIRTSSTASATSEQCYFTSADDACDESGAARKPKVGAVPAAWKAA